MEVNGTPDPCLQSVFSAPPLVAYRKQKDTKESIVRAKVAAIRQQRVHKGLKKCGKCLACRYVKEGKIINGKDYKRKTFLWKVGRHVSCESKNIVDRPGVAGAVLQTAS